MRMKDEEWNDIIENQPFICFPSVKKTVNARYDEKASMVVLSLSVLWLVPWEMAVRPTTLQAKAGLIGFSKSLAREVASRGITVNVVAPGFIETDMTRALTDEQRAGTLAAVPAGRLGSPNEIASAVAFLASDEAGYITGETLHVNGGMYMV